MIADDLSLGAIVQRENIVLAVGYDANDEACYFEWSDDDGTTKHAFANGDTRKLIGISDEQQPALVVLETGEILATLASGGAKTYLSSDWGETWTFLEAIS